MDGVNGVAFTHPVSTDDDGNQVIDKKHVICQHPVPSKYGNGERPCGLVTLPRTFTSCCMSLIVLRAQVLGYNTKTMDNHVKSYHRPAWEAIQRLQNPGKIHNPAVVCKPCPEPDLKRTACTMSVADKQEVDRLLALWVARSDRPASIAADEGLRRLLLKVQQLPGVYMPCNDQSARMLSLAPQMPKQSPAAPAANPGAG